MAKDKEPAKEPTVKELQAAIAKLTKAHGSANEEGRI
jgi:hypothetical protein